MKHRKLRIAWSVACGITVLLLIVLWVRSYWWHDTAFMRIANSATQETYYDVSSDHGGVTMLATDYPPDSFARFGFSSLRTIESKWPTGLTPQFSRFGFVALRDGVRMRRYVTIPDWFSVLLVGALATFPWVRWSSRFSLRALLIATTLVAVGLGLFASAPK